MWSPLDSGGHRPVEPTLGDLNLSGRSPSGSRVIRRGDGVGVLEKNVVNYRYIERLEMDSVVGNISGEREAE